MRIFPKTPADGIRLLALAILLAFVAWHYNAQSVWYYLSYSPREGDILFQSIPGGGIVQVIEGTTHSPYSHCGVVLRQQDKWVVIEAGKTVRETSLWDWIQRGRGAGFAAYRLKPQYAASLPDFKKNLQSYLGKPYDHDYEISDDAIYCSEFIYKAFQKSTGEKMGTLEKLGDLDWKPYEDFIRSSQGSLPLDRIMITPKSLSTGNQLDLVFSRGIQADK